MGRTDNGRQSHQKAEPVVIINHTTQPAKVPQKQSVRPTPAPVVNSEADPLTGFLSSLSPSCKAEAVKYSEIPDRDLKIPTGQSATAILTAFAKKHAKVPKGTRNATLFLYACTLEAVRIRRAHDPRESLAVLPSAL